jgi:hypothetical protein
MPVQGVIGCQHPLQGFPVEHPDVCVFIDVILIVPVKEIVLKNRDVNQ